MTSPEAPQVGLNAAVAAVVVGELRAQGMTLKQFAAEAGISYSTAKHLLSARDRDISVAVLAAFCRVLNRPMTWVFEAAESRLAWEADASAPARVDGAIGGNIAPEGVDVVPDKLVVRGRPAAAGVSQISSRSGATAADAEPSASEQEDVSSALRAADKGARRITEAERRRREMQQLDKSAARKEDTGA